MATQGRRAALSETPEDSPRIEEPTDDLVEDEVVLPVEDVDSPEDDGTEDDGSVRLEDLDPKSELFDNGPSVAQVLAWKSEFGNVYVTSFDLDQHYVWRPVTRFEYRRLVKQMEQSIASGQITQAEANLNNEEAMCELCILFPKFSRSDMAAEMAGVASIIAQEIMEASAFVALDVRQL